MESPVKGIGVAIDARLPNCLKKGLLTDIECRIIVSASPLSEKQLAVYRIIMSKPKKQGAKLTKRFRKLTRGVHWDEVLKFRTEPKHLENESLISPFEKEKNPMLNNMVIKCVLACLRLDDIKTCRFVCRRWNSTAEIFLRKRSVIHFRPNCLRPATFLKVCKYSLPDLPFTGFKFSSNGSNKKYAWLVSEIQDFFEKWGKNIRKIHLNKITLEKTVNSKSILKYYDVTPWFANACNITELIIQSPHVSEGVSEISIGESESLSGIKNLVLLGCTILSGSGKENPCTAPLSIYLFGVSVTREGKAVDNFRYNDLFDFRQAKDIILHNFHHIPNAKFDMRDIVFDTDELTLTNVVVENWGDAKGYVRHIKLKEVPFLKKHQLKIKSLYSVGSKINLSCLPPTIETLLMSECTEVLCTEPLQLQNLRILQFEVSGNNSNVLTHFANCENLTALILDGEMEDNGRVLNTQCIPSSVKTITVMGLQMDFFDDHILDLYGTLVLDGCQIDSLFTDCEKITQRIRAHTLVLFCYKHMEVVTSDILKLICANERSKRIIICAQDKDDNLQEKIPFQQSCMMGYWIQKSNYYEFYWY